MKKCFICGSKLGIRFEIKVQKWIERYSRSFCSYACFKKWLVRNIKSLNDFTEPPCDGGKYIEKCFYPDPYELPKAKKRKKKHGR